METGQVEVTGILDLTLAFGANVQVQIENTKSEATLEFVISG